MDVFLFSPANSCPCHQATSCHIILHHIMSYYVMYQTCIQILSSVKGVLISPFMEWHGAYILGQICIEFICQWGARGGKRFGPLLVVNIFGTTRRWGESKIFQASHWATCQSPHIWGNVHELMCRGGRVGGGSKNKDPTWIVKQIWMTITEGLNILRHLTELLANLPIT